MPLPLSINLLTTQSASLSIVTFQSALWKVAKSLRKLWASWPRWPKVESSLKNSPKLIEIIFWTSSLTMKEPCLRSMKFFSPSQTLSRVKFWQTPPTQSILMKALKRTSCSWTNQCSLRIRRATILRWTRLRMFLMAIIRLALTTCKPALLLMI